MVLFRWNVQIFISKIFEKNKNKHSYSSVLVLHTKYTDDYVWITIATQRVS